MWRAREAPRRLEESCRSQVATGSAGLDEPGDESKRQHCSAACPRAGARYAQPGHATRRITAIREDVRLNSGLWELALARAA